MNFSSLKSQRSWMSPPFVLSNGPFLESRVLVQHGQHCQAANGEELVASFLQKQLVDRREPGCEREETTPVIS
jgi:hypothetical protein